jgi:hypothetical protein
MTQQVFELLKACCAGKGENDYVFTRENGVRVKDFRGAWESVTKPAGVPSLSVTICAVLVPVTCAVLV